MIQGAQGQIHDAGAQSAQQSGIIPYLTLQSTHSLPTAAPVPVLSASPHCDPMIDCPALYRQIHIHAALSHDLAALCLQTGYQAVAQTLTLLPCI